MALMDEARVRQVVHQSSAIYMNFKKAGGLCPLNRTLAAPCPLFVFFNPLSNEQDQQHMRYDLNDVN
jgi:hypothetical protein